MNLFVTQICMTKPLFLQHSIEPLLSTSLSMYWQLFWWVVLFTNGACFFSQLLFIDTQNNIRKNLDINFSTKHENSVFVSILKKIKNEQRIENLLFYTFSTSETTCKKNLSRYLKKLLQEELCYNSFEVLEIAFFVLFLEQIKHEIIFEHLKGIKISSFS